MLSCLYFPNQGTLKVNNRQVFDSQDLITTKISYMSQTSSLFNRSIKENILYPNNDIKNKKNLEQILSVSLCDNFLNKLPYGLDSNVSNLSQGQKHLVSIAQILASEAEWIILDEPFISLDPIIEEKLISNIMEYLQNKTLIVVTHSPKIQKLMDRTIIIDSGRIEIDSKLGDLSNSQFYNEYIGSNYD